MEHLARFASALLILACSTAQAQTLIINLESGASETYALANVRSITFPSGQLSVNLNDATSEAWPIAEIRSYAFGDLSTGSDAHGLVQASLSAWPNPSSGVVRIRLNGPSAERARIDLMDLTGRSLELVFDGPMPEDGLRIEHVTKLASGPCLVRAATPAGTIVLPLTIQR